MFFLEDKMKIFITLFSLLLLFSCSEDESFRIVAGPAPAAVIVQDCSYSAALNFVDGAGEDGSCRFAFCNEDNYENSNRPYYENVIQPYLNDLQVKGIPFSGGIDSQACENKIGCKNTYADNYDSEAAIESELCIFSGCPEQDPAYLASFNAYIDQYPNYSITRSCDQVKTLSFKKIPTEVIATNPFSDNVEVEIRNVLDMTLTSNNTAQITLSAWLDNQCTVPAAGNLLGTLTRTVVAGVATFNDLIHDRVEDIYLRAQTGSIVKCSGKIQITQPATIDSLTFKEIPNAVVATKDFEEDVEVEIRNVLGTVVADNNTAIVTLSPWLDNQCTVPANGNLMGTLTRTVVAGVAKFGNLKYDTVEDIYLRASSGSKTACSNKINVNPPTDIAALNFKNIPESVIATKPFSENVEVEILNSFGALIDSNNTAQITLSAWTDDQCSQLAPGNLGGTLTRTVVAGVAAFTDLSYDQPVDIYLRAESGGIIKCSEKIEVSEPTDIESLSFKAYPPTVIATEIFPIDVEVEIKNFFENVITSNNDAQITVSAWLDDQCTTSANGTLSGNLTRTVVAGVATFDDLAYDTLENIYLRAQTGDKTVCSGLIKVYPPTNIHTVHFIDIPTEVMEAMPFDYDVKVEVRNIFGMTLTENNSDQVTISAWANNTCDAPGIGGLGGTLIQTLAAGIATFNDLSYDANEDIYLKAEVMGKTTCSNLIDVLPKPEAVEDNYTQMVNNKVDVLMLIDNSGSMGDEITNMKNNINLFVQEFVMQDVDYQFVTATTVENFGGYYARPHPINSQLKKANYDADPALFIINFQKVLTNYSNLGGSVEVPYRAANKLLMDYPSYRRSDASLSILVFGDEREQSTEKTINQWYNLYKNYYEKVQVSCIVRQNADPDNRYQNMATLGNGYYEDITDPDFHLKLQPIGAAAALLPKTFALTQPPVQATIKVYLNGDLKTLNVDYTYDAILNVIVFSTAPAIGDSVMIKYEKMM